MTNRGDGYTGLSDFSDLDIQKIKEGEQRRDKLTSKLHRVRNGYISKM